MSRSRVMRAVMLCIAVSSTAAVSFAQTKVGVVSLQRAVLESEEIKKISSAMEAKFRPRQQELQKIEQELQTIQQQIQAGQGKLNSQTEADLTAQGQRRQREAQRLQEDLQADVERERNEVLSKSTRQMQEVVQKLASEKGLDVVIDQQNAIFFKPAMDITPEAIAAYNKAYPAK